MREMDGRSILLLGFKGSGKTTLLAALWHLLEAQEIRSELLTPTLQPDREHLNAIRQRWLELQRMERTGLQQPQIVSVNVEDRQSGVRGSIVFPDISGEVFRIQWEERAASQDYVELAARSQGALLFIHPDGVNPSPRIGPAAPKTAKDDDHKVIAWDPKLAPTQVQLVDVVQTYLGFAEMRPLRIAVVVSAWDLIDDEGVTPETWFCSRLPLLSQFLTSLADAVKVRYYGVSAQGGELTEAKSKLQSFSKPSERVLVVDETQRHSDLTAIAKWVMLG